MALSLTGIECIKIYPIDKHIINSYLNIVAVDFR